ncbi:hypothetical protein EVAR_91433_1 [Eumeta japonica]|uniref:Uncharacterized protein n=1 Tax=Eumeta variegata TaxID=151549 RepID=A0A4C1WZH5_EUMVA|nr:hypothetical protein EVAR_91433_1 [Eumeta japonica]
MKREDFLFCLPHLPRPAVPGVSESNESSARITEPISGLGLSRESGRAPAGARSRYNHARRDTNKDKFPAMPRAGGRALRLHI